MINTKKVSEIIINKEESWQNSIYITFDVDWAHDEIIKDTFDIIQEAKVSATWFITHQTKLIRDLRRNKNFDLGIHPNFENLLRGDNKNGKNANEILSNLTGIVPEALAIRSHSLTQSSHLQNLFKKEGLKYDLNHFIPLNSGIELKPWILWNGLIKIPFCWEDDIECMYGNNTNLIELNKHLGLKVLDFHPIHIFLNTKDLNLYQSTREFHQQPDKLIKFRNRGYGIRNQLFELLSLFN